jgi:histidinol-phosphate aminotransferase
MSNIDQQVKSLLKPVIQTMQPYHVAPSAGLLKLDAMENPYQWDTDIKQQWLAFLASAEINRYPSAAAEELCHKLKEVMQVPSGLDIMLGNGSDEIIQILTMAMTIENASLFAVEPSFVMYKIIADTVGMHYISVLLNKDFSLDMPSIMASIQQHQPNLLFFAVPNNPTANSFSKDELCQIIEAAEGLVVIDEAYIAFTEADMLELAVRYDNVLIMRTLSKVGLAGLRLGMLIGKPVWINQFNKIRLPYNINVLTQMTALFALQHYEILQRQAESIKQQRTVLARQLSALDGVEVFPSQANFLLIRTTKDAKQIFESLKKSGVLIKCLAGGHPLLTQCLRITVSTEAENEVFLEAFKKALT